MGPRVPHAAAEARAPIRRRLQIKREQILYAEARTASCAASSSLQGAAKEPRHARDQPRRDAPAPATARASVAVWPRTGGLTARRNCRGGARGRDRRPAAHCVLIPRQSADDLQAVIIEAEAAQQTLDAKGTPSDAARAGGPDRHAERRDSAAAERDRLIAEIVANAKVFQGGGHELLLPSWTNDSGQRQMPGWCGSSRASRTPTHTAWERSIKRAREGSDAPFQPVGHAGATEQHPVAQQVCTTSAQARLGRRFGASCCGRPVRLAAGRGGCRADRAAPRSAHHGDAQRYRGRPGPARSEPDPQGRIPRRARHADRRGARRRFASCSANSTRLQERRGGEAGAGLLASRCSISRARPAATPRCQRSLRRRLEDLARLAGNEQLVALKDRADDLAHRIDEWKAPPRHGGRRLPGWTLLDGLATHAAALPEAKDVLEQVAAIREQRLLLEPPTPCLRCSARWPACCAPR